MKHTLSIVLLTLFFGICIATTDSSKEQHVYFQKELIGTIYEMENVDLPPQPVFRHSPKYPKVIERKVLDFQNKHGYPPAAAFIFIVSKEGTVSNIIFERPDMKETIPYWVEAFKKWEFKPAQIDGKPVNVRMRIPVMRRPTK
ncbi:MAG: energy transducer TonB [Flavobacteriaceae bacterium]